MKNSSKTSPKKPKLSPIQEMKRFRRVYRRILKCKNAMRIASEKKEKALIFAHDYRFYDKDDVIEDHKRLLEVYKSVEAEKDYENEYFAKFIPYIEDLIERKQKIDELQNWTEINIKTFEKLLDHDREILRKETRVLDKEEHRTEETKVIKRLSKIRDEYDREIPEKMNAQLKVKECHDQIKFALNHRRLFYMELDNYAKQYLSHLIDLEPILYKKLLETYEEIPKHLRKIKFNKENMNRIIKVNKTNLRQGWFLCIQELDVKFFQGLKLRQRPKRKYENPFQQYITSIQDNEKEIWRYRKLFGDIRTELQLTGVSGQPMNNIIKNTIYGNGDLFYHFICLRLSVEEEITQISEIKDKRLEIQKAMHKENEENKEIIFEMELINKQLERNITSLNMKIHGNRVLRELFYAYYQKLFYLVGCTHDEIPNYRDHIKKLDNSTIEFLLPMLEQQVYWLVCKVYNMEQFITPNEIYNSGIPIFRMDPITPMNIISPKEPMASMADPPSVDICWACIQLLIDEDDEKKRLVKENRERFQDPEKVKKEESFVMIDIPNLSKYAQEILENYDIDSCMHSYRECPRKEGIALKKSVDEEQTQRIKARDPPF